MVTSVTGSMTVADYCREMDRKDIVVNREYQRSDKVWPDAARSFLIETILLGYPIPKFFLHSITDPKSKKTRKEIVDGQQRSRTIHDFYNDKLTIGGKSEVEQARGLVYRDLPQDLQSKFLGYSLSVDQFVGATPSEVRQIFRRMNSYTVPLNPEEMRNAEFQGPFKWFIYEMGQQTNGVITSLSVFTDKSLVRMQDLKLLTEISHAMLNGITTTNNSSLKKIYTDYDELFPEEDKLGTALSHAFDKLGQMDYLTGTNLTKPYHIYSLVLALAHSFMSVPNLAEPAAPKAVDLEAVEDSFMALSDALDLPENKVANSPFKAFIDASSEKTNVRGQREIRTTWFIKALKQEF
jgi:hypothetical protein